MDEHDLLIVVDATSSMQNYLLSLNAPLPQILSVSAATGRFSRAAIIAYQDFKRHDNYLEFPAWLYLASVDEPARQPDLISIARILRAIGGGDDSSAAKTALPKAYHVMRPGVQTLILLYTDDPPHRTDGMRGAFTNADTERNALRREDSYGGFGPSFLDWVSAAKTLAHGQKQAQALALLDPNVPPSYMAYYNFLCAMGNDAYIRLRDSKPTTISKVTVDVLLAWMGVEKPTVGDMQDTVPGDLGRYVSPEHIWGLENEAQLEAARFFPVSHTPGIENSAMAADNLGRIITMDPTVISHHPFFGGSWRAICRDQVGSDYLVKNFSRNLGNIPDVKELEKLYHKYPQASAKEPETSSFTVQSLIHTVATMGVSSMSRISPSPWFRRHLTQQGIPIPDADPTQSTLARSMGTEQKPAKAPCSLCCALFPPSSMGSMCDQLGCHEQVCTGCSSAWYGSNKPGGIIIPGAVLCPFCRRRPSSYILAEHGNGIDIARGLDRAIKESEACIYAWCSQCSELKEYMERVCAHGETPELTNWTCEGCSAELETKNWAKSMKPCPKCETMTERTGGCGHMACPVQGCAADWCYYCGKAFEDIIFYHMETAHPDLHGDGEYIDEGVGWDDDGDDHDDDEEDEEDEQDEERYDDADGEEDEEEWLYDL
ncbi:hypothetical protein BJX99DRAFT_221914 [Aspergillus californicus]